MTTATWAAVGGRALWNGQSLDHWSDVLASELVQLFNPVEVWLFGSVATNDDTVNSDLDLLVVLDHYEPCDAMAMKRRAILAVSAPVPFDVAFSDPDDVTTQHLVDSARSTLPQATAIVGRTANPTPRLGYVPFGTSEHPAR